MKLEERTGPFGNAALAYVKAGWPEALPIWRGGQRDKQPMVRGYHGREGTWPDETTSRLWAGRYARANIALRLPRWVVGLDVDHYGSGDAAKYGGDSLAELQDELGPLPNTLVSTSRADGVSGIRLFMVPGDYAAASWPAQAAVDIDMITWYERYVICAPSVHRSGNTYKWYRQHGRYHELRLMGGIPGTAHTAALPAEWCEYLTGLAGRGQEKWDDKKYDGSARQWLIDYGGGLPCRYIEGTGVRILENMNDGGSVHDVTKLAIARLVKAAAEGHRGINSALAPMRELFIYKLGSRSADERRRGEAKAVSEWRAMVAGAVAKYGGEVADEDTVCDELRGF